MLYRRSAATRKINRQDLVDEDFDFLLRDKHSLHGLQTSGIKYLKGLDRHKIDQANKLHCATFASKKCLMPVPGELDLLCAHPQVAFGRKRQET